MKFITIKYKIGTCKVKLEQVYYIQIDDNAIEFRFRDDWVLITEENAINFKEVKEIVENL